MSTTNTSDKWYKCTNLQELKDWRADRSNLQARLVEWESISHEGCEVRRPLRWEDLDTGESFIITYPEEIL